MATNYYIPTGHPNILVIYGSDVYLRRPDGSYDIGNNRFSVQTYIRSNPSGCPVTQYSHDFWITNIVGLRYSDFDPSTVLHDDEHDFRGCVRMGLYFSSLSAEIAADYLWTLLQENAHYWLVPNDMMFGGNRVSLSGEFQEAFMSGNAFPQLQLIGRSEAGVPDAHWSAHIEANPSPLDGIGWNAIETINLEGTNADPNILRKYDPPITSPNNISIEGVGSVPYGNYPDLDKVIMGALPKGSAYSKDGYGFYELIPQWAAPVNFQGGMTLVFSLTDVVIFGFSRGFNRIGISRSGSDFSEVWDISSFYKPWEFESRIVFRVIRIGDQYYFQAKQEIGTIGCFATVLQSLRLYTPPPETDPYEGWQQPGQPIVNPQNLQSWTTLKVIQNSTPPIGIGYGAKTWFPDGWIDFSFKPLRVRDAATQYPPVGTNPVTFNNVTTADYTSSLNNNRFLFHKPTNNPRIRGNASLCNLTVNGDANNGTDIDQMPKLLVSPPTGNFVASGSIRLDRCCLAPWAAGAYTGVNLWARRRKIQMSGLQLNDNVAYRRITPGGPYKEAFIIVAEHREDITSSMLDNLDKLRVAYETVFNTATSNSRSVNTNL